MNKGINSFIWRFVELLLLCMIFSAATYIVYRMGYIPNSHLGCFTSLSIMSAVYYIIQLVMLRRLYEAVPRIREYFIISIGAQILFAMADTAALLRLSSVHYAWIFSITKFLHYRPAGLEIWQSMAVFQILLFIDALAAPLGVNRDVNADTRKKRMSDPVALLYMKVMNKTIGDKEPDTSFGHKRHVGPITWIMMKIDDRRGGNEDGQDEYRPRKRRHFRPISGSIEWIGKKLGRDNYDGEIEYTPKNKKHFNPISNALDKRAERAAQKQEEEGYDYKRRRKGFFNPIAYAFAWLIDVIMGKKRRY